MTQQAHTNTTTANWRQVSLYLGITFGLTFLLDLLLHLTVGYGQNVGTGLVFQTRMLIPAAVAIALQFFVFRDSRIYHLKERPRWFFFFYLAYAGFYALMACSVLFVSNTIYQTIASVVVQLVNIGGLVFLVIWRLVSGREAFEVAGLAGGKIRYWITFGLLVVLVCAAMTGLNALFGLGQAVDVQEFLRQASGGQATGLEALPSAVVLLIVGFQTVFLGPMLGLLLAFGEEYGWRGYLQGELIKLGKVRGILVVGIIWGLWHFPVILMGYNYPGYPVLGILLMTLVTILLSFLFGYAMLKSGSVWLAAFLHAVVNQTLSFLILMIYAPADPVYSFGIGLYGLVVWALVIGAILLLDRKEWLSPVEPRLQVELAGE
jgi:membrane protease YdiL (CAAX protease family)